MLKIMTIFLFSLSSLLSYAKPVIKQGLIHTPTGPQKAYYEQKGSVFLTEWDIQVEPYKKKHKNDKAVTRQFGKWKNKTIPYKIDSTIPAKERIYDAIDYFNTHTSLRFVPRERERDYVYFKNSGKSDCSSWVGRKGGKQSIRIPDWCPQSSVMHEMLHALGFYHEQSRLDRDKYLKIHWNNIKWIYLFNFRKAPFSRNYGEFDFNSIMLYPSFNGFAVDEKKPTMTRRDNGEPFGYASFPSELDLRALEERYQ